jgi:lysozyme
MVRLPVAELHASPMLRDFVKGFETLSLTVYRCPSGAPTQGWGHTKGITMESPPITTKEADRWFDEDIATAERLLKMYVRVPMHQGEFDAVVSFAFNVGPGRPGKKDGLVWLKKQNGARAVHSTMLVQLNAADYRAAADQFPLWANGRDAAGRLVKLEGLLKRREAERRIFLGDTGGYLVRP